MQKISIIVAMSKNNVIGANNALPWHISEDLKRFKSLTMGKPIIMGRKTFDSIGRPLPGRKNIVITRNTDLKIKGVDVVSSLDNVFSLIKDEEQVFVIGGEEIYRIFLDHATHLYVTEIDSVLEGDAYFPQFSANYWQEISREKSVNEEGLHFSFVDYQRQD